MQYAPTLTDEKVYSQDQFWGYAKWYDTFFDLKNGHAKSIIPLFESKKCYAKRHDHFFDLENGYAESIIPLFESKKEYAKRQEKISGTCF